MTTDVPRRARVPPTPMRPAGPSVRLNTLKNVTTIKKKLKRATSSSPGRTKQSLSSKRTRPSNSWIRPRGVPARKGSRLRSPSGRQTDRRQGDASYPHEGTKVRREAGVHPALERDVRFPGQDGPIDIDRHGENRRRPDKTHATATSSHGRDAARHRTVTPSENTIVRIFSSQVIIYY